MTESSDEDGPACTHCGEKIDASANRRVVPTLEDGSAVLATFCGAHCLENWSE